MEDEERRRKLEAGKAKLAEYRQRKAQSDGQKKKKKKSKGSELQGEQEECEERKDVPSTELSFSRTVHSGETVKHEQTFTIEPESEITSTAEDYSSEEEDEEEEEEISSPSRLQDMENKLAAKTMAVQELSRELETIRATFGAEGVQQLQDFEAALKQRDAIITQLTANLQQARAEKDEVMREFLDLTEKSQKLQIQFQQLQAGESLRSSSISSAAADLLQTRQQVLLHQQQLEEKEGKIKSLTEETDKKVKHLQEQLEESAVKVTSLQQQRSEMTQSQQMMSDLETTLRDTEVSLTLTLQEKDLRIEEKERLILEHQQLLSQLRDNLQSSEKRFINVSEQLEAKAHHLHCCEAELQASKEKEQLSSGEILQLMGTVEALQKRYHQGSRLESEVLQRAELDAAQRLDHLRAELDEMYGQQIVQMKQELVARHKEEMANILNRHSTELRNVSDQHRIQTKQLTSQLTQSTGDVNALNVRVIELQQRLQEVQVLREKAEHDLTQMSEEQFLLKSQMQHLIENLRLKEQEKSQSEVHLQLTATITDLQAQLTSVQEASSELEAKHESEITNYQIKLEMLEREKDAVLDRMAESQEAELERLRTHLLFSHEEELSRLRQDLQHESQMNVENLRDELNQRHQESAQQLRNGYEEQIRVDEEERLVLSAERTSLLQEIVTLKNDLNQALENSQVEELVLQLKSLQAEIQELRQRHGEEDEPHELYKHELTEESKQKWKEMESENKRLKETKAALTEELRSLEEHHKMLMKKMDTVISENRQANELAEELRAEIERQKSTYSFAEKNFEVNYQELRAELEERLRVQALQYETKLQDHETPLQNLNSGMKHGSIQSEKEEDKEPDGGALVEKDTTELMEKLQRVELERQELVKLVKQNESEMKKLKLESIKLEELMNSKDMELRRVKQENSGLSEQVEQKEAKLKMVELERAGLVKQLGQNEAELERLQPERAELEEQTKFKDLELKKAAFEKVDLVQQVDQKEVELNRIKLEKAELVQQVDQKEVELNRIKLEKVELVQQVDQKEVELDGIKLEKTDLVQQVDQKEVELDGIKLEKAELVQQVAQKEVELDGIKLEKAELVQQVDQKEVELDGIKLEKTDLVQQVDQKEVELDGIKLEKAELVQQVAQKEVELDGIKLEKAELVQQVDQKEVELDGIKLEKAELVQQVAQKEVELDGIKLVKAELVQQVDQKEVELNRIKLEKAELAQQVDQKEVELDGIKLEKAELVQQVDQKAVMLHQQEAELQKLKLEKTKLVKQLDQEEEELQEKKEEIPRVTVKDTLVQVVEQKDGVLQEKKAELQRMNAEKAERTDQVPLKKAAWKSRPKPSRVKSSDSKSGTRKKSQMKTTEAELQEEGVGETGQRLAPPLSPAVEEEERPRETHVCVVHRNDGVKQQTHTHTKIKAAEETHSQEHTHTHTRTHTQPAAATSHTAKENKLKSDSERQGECQYGDADLVPTLTDNMEGNEHEECRLQLEAQRISLSQIHAAQLELLKERLPEWEEPESQGVATASVCSASIISITQDFTHLLQLVAGVCGVDSVDVTEEQLQNLQPCTIRHILHTTQEVYRKLQQLDAGVTSVSENGNETVCDDHSVRTEDDVHTSTLNDLQEELQEEVKEEQLELQEEVKEEQLELKVEEEEEQLELKVEEQEEELELKEEQHRQEIESLRSYFSEQISEMEERYTQEILLLQDRLKDLTPADTLHSMASIPAEEQQLQVRQSVMEEEIARVIVQMSVEFARQSESRVCMQEREETRQGAGPERGIQMEDEPRRRGVERQYPSMQCSSTQTEQLRRRGGEDEERKRKDEQCEEEEVTVTSQLISVDTQERVHQVLMDLLKMAALTKETVRDESITRPAEAPETDLLSSLSGATDTDEGLDMFREAGLAVERAESLWSVSSKLQKTVETLITTLTDTHTQLDHARLTQTELMKEKFTCDQQIADLLNRQEELQRRLEEERTAREKLTLQLHHAEGLIDGYSGERRALEEQVCDGAGRQQQLEAELQVTSTRLQELHQERQQDLLLRQQDAGTGGATEAELSLVEAAVDDAPDAGLLEETEKLLQEKVDVQRQAQKDHAELLEQVKQMEAELEEQVRSTAKLEETHQSVTSDLHQQIHALEKQLENNRRFLDEQAADREQERDVFQQEIQKLEQQLKSSSKPQADHRQVEELSVALQEKADWCSELSVRVEQLQRDVQERDEEIEQQEERMRVLEEVLVSHDNRNITAAEEDTKQYASMAGGADATLEALLQTEREALDRKEKEIVNLEEQLEQFRDELQNKSEEVQQLHMQLEIQRKEISTQQQDLQAHTRLKTVLEEKNTQIALLNEQIDKLQRSEPAKPDVKEVEVKNQLVCELETQVEYLRGEQDRLKRGSEEEVEQLNSVIDKLQQELSNIEHKQSVQEEEDGEEDQHDELKQKMDQIQRELDTLTEEHSLLLSKYGSLQEERETKEEQEKKNEMLVHELENILREKTAALVVAQVQIHALEECANSTVSSLTQRVEQLDTCLEEREDELRECRSEGDKAKSEAGTLRLKVSQLEEKLKEKVAILRQMVNQEHQETNIQTKESECEIRIGTSLHDDERELKIKHEESLSFSIAGKEMGLTQQCGVELDQENNGKLKMISEDKKELMLNKPDAALMGSGSEMPVEQCAVNAMKNVLLLIEKLRKLEVDLSSMPKDQELQKHLLASSEEDVEEYEKMLLKLMKMLDQMRSARPSPVGILSGRTETEKLHQELQQDKDQSAADNEHLDSCRNLNQNLQEQIQRKEELLEELQEDLHRASERSSEDSTVISALHQELQEVKGQAEATEKELNSCKDLSRRLQEQIEEQEKVISSVLKDQVHETTHQAQRSKLIQELQHIKHQTAANKEELNNYKEQSLKLQEQIQARDASIVQLMEELQHHRTALTESGAQEGSRSSQRSSGRDDNQLMSDSAAQQQDRPSLSTSSPVSPSADRVQSVSTLEVGTQVEGAELGVELEEVIGEYTQRIEQIRELHAAEIMDMENRHIAESESLKKENRRVEQECATLREGVDKLRPLQVLRSDQSYSSVYRDGYTSDSSSEVGSEFRSTPEGARPDDTHLPDRIKALLREVHQEGMQVLSLSECDESADRSSLLAQITHLQAQLTQLRQDTHTNQQLHERQTERQRQVEECERLRVELAQVRLELKTSLKTEHTHKRELGTLRAEVCMKASELDAVSERLAEEQRRARELQWEVERERSRMDRRTEGQTEELEDMKLALEEERQVLAQRETELSKYTGLVTQLQVQLDSQNSRLKEMSSDLQKEKELNAELLKHTQHPLQVEDGGPSLADSVLQSLQVQLEEKQATLMELRAQVEQKVMQELEQKQQWQDERRLLQRRVDELQSLLEGERERRKATERERERLEGRVSEMMERSSTSEQVGEQVLEQKSDKPVSQDSIGTYVLNIAGATCSRDMDSVVAILQQMYSKISRLAVEGADGESFSWLKRNIQEVMLFLQKSSSVPPAGPESAALLIGGVSSVLTERLLRQNAELTGFVSRLTEEKNELRNQILRLEEELRRQRHLKAHSSLGFGAEVPGGALEVQKEVWMREKSRMEKSLHQAEAEISRLRAEIRSDTVRDLNASNTDNATIKRIYGKYLRAESFRKALIYQKKYLLLLLGGFQDCEEATLSLIAGMSSPHVHTHTTFLECVSQRRRGYTRFRSAARVCIALFRMRFLVRRWQKVTGGSTTITRNGVGQSPVMEVRTDSPYLQPRGTTRGRTGQESPHTTHYRFGGMVTDAGVLCSHLQSYDPDRALSDYITRLEALQRRLGSVQSGSSSYTQTHFGLRR